MCRKLCLKTKKIISIALATSLILSGCSNTNNKKNNKHQTTSAPKANTVDSYEDDIMSCEYDRLQLTYSKVKANGSIDYGVVFSKNTDTMEDDIMNGNVTYFGVTLNDTDYDESKSLYLPVLAKAYFNGLFHIENDNSKIIENDDKTYNYENISDETECYGKLFSMDSNEIVIAVCRIIKDTDKKQKAALLNCFNSMKYLKDSSISSSEDSSDTETNQDKYSKILNNKEFQRAIAEILAKLKVSDIETINIVQDTDLGNGDIEYLVSITTDDKPLSIATDYLSLTDSFVVIKVENSENKHIYYLPKDVMYLDDIYDYKTDKVISKAKK